ncbi:MAG TPA: hypothetical protein VEF06_08460 [Bryobacteraceae bacterium]|nr:hypothetical protein [Bryobacteraceae bacterium]
MQYGSTWRPQALLLIPVSAALLFAADAAWQEKPVSNWTQEDARQILTNSPWAKVATGSLRRLETEFELRDGGRMGQPHGVGYDGVDPNQDRGKLPRKYFTAKPGEKSPPRQDLKFQLRWESAMPVRAAELKSGFIEPPVLSGDGYSLAVYGIPGSFFNEDPSRLGKPLKESAVIKRVGKKDVKPVTVEVFQREDGLAVVYQFPASAEFTSRDGIIEFEAVIGRVALSQYFDTSQMQFQGKLEL